MNLQQKHFEAIENNIEIEGSQYVDAEKSAESSAKITKDYMKRFAEWKDKNYVLYSDFENFKYVDRIKSNANPYRVWKRNEIKTTDELIEIFLQNENPKQ